MAGEKTCRHLLLSFKEDEREWKCPMDREIPAVSKFPKKSTTSESCPKFLKRVPRKFLFHSILYRNSTFSRCRHLTKTTRIHFVFLLVPQWSLITNALMNS